MYTPAPPYEDVPKEGVPRITEEEFLSLKEAGEAISKARSEFARRLNNILNRYGKTQIEVDKSGKFSFIVNEIRGHNIERMECIV